MAEKAGIHRSSFYRYYTDIYLVLDDFQEELLASIKRESIDKFDFENLTTDRMKEYVQVAAKVLEKKQIKYIGCSIAVSAASSRLLWKNCVT